MKDTLQDYLINQYGTLDESGAGLSRVLQKLESNEGFIFITAFRGSESTKNNIKKNNDLIKSLRSEIGTKVGAYKIVGHWKECSEPLKDNEDISKCKGTITNALEETWLIIKPESVSSDDFDKVAQKIAKKYNQDAYVIRKNGKLTLNGKDGSVWEDLGKANKESLSSGFSKISNIQGYSELKKLRNKGRTQNIVFEGISLVIPKDNNMSKMLFDKANILF